MKSFGPANSSNSKWKISKELKMLSLSEKTLFKLKMFSSLRVFYKKLGSGHSTKSNLFAIIFMLLTLKSFLVLLRHSARVS